MIERVEATDPGRVVLDSRLELRLPAQNPPRYRRQILALKHFFAKRNCAVLVLDNRFAGPGDLQLHSVAHGVVSLEQMVSDFGSERRRVQVVKMRVLRFRGGYHDSTIESEGIRVYLRLIASDHRRSYSSMPITTGLAVLDALRGDGLARGTNARLTGLAGVGKSTTTVHCLIAALQRGQNAAYFLFDERHSTLLIRSRARSMGLAPDIDIDNGLLMIRQVDTAELSPSEFTGAVREAVEGHDAHVFVIGGLNAYLHAIPRDNFLMLQMQELLSYLSQQGVVSLLVLGQHGVVGDLHSEIDVSYLADTVVLMRFFEAEGQVRKSIAVIRPGPLITSARSGNFASPVAGWR